MQITSPESAELASQYLRQTKSSWAELAPPGPLWSDAVEEEPPVAKPEPAPPPPDQDPGI